MTEFLYIAGIDIASIANKEFIRIDTDKAQEICVALDKSGIPFSARYGENEMVLTYDGSYKEQVERSSQRRSPAIMEPCYVNCKSAESLTVIIVS